MSFVRKRGSSHQLIESYREGGKVRQRVIANLGPWATPEEALHGWAPYVERLESKLRDREEHLAAADRHVAAMDIEPARYLDRDEDPDRCLIRDPRRRGQPYPDYGQKTRPTIRKEVVHWRRRVACERANLGALRRVVSNCVAACNTI